jgi:membrane protein DedA with SNARE-associated domain
VLKAIAEAAQNLVSSIGYPGLFFLIVLESTAVPIPSLLVMPFAGYLAWKGEFSLPLILVINSAGALTGSWLSYWVGAKAGKPLLLKYGKWFFIRQKDLEKTEEYFAKHGGKTIFIGRFLPVVRHLISLPAGIARMPIMPFSLLTLAGASLWGGGLMVVGYVLGPSYEAVVTKAKRIDLVFAGLIVVAIVAIAVRFYLKRRRAKATASTSTS